MKIPEVTPSSCESSRQITTSDGNPQYELATLLAGLERQKEELGPIAVELIDLLHHLGVDQPPLQGRALTPSNE